MDIEWCLAVVSLFSQKKMETKVKALNSPGNNKAADLNVNELRQTNKP